MNISSITDKNRSFIIYSLVAILFLISAYLIYTFSPELSKLFGYADSNTMLMKQLFSVAIGIAIVYVFGKLNRNIWFNRIGVTFFIIPLILLIMMVFISTSFSAYVNDLKLYIVIGGITINPIEYFPIGALWLIAWSHDNKNKLFTNITILTLMITTAGFCIEFNNMGALLMLEALFITMLVYINGINRFTIISLLTTVGVGILFVLMAEHRMKRIMMWFQSSSDFMTTLSIENALHENILLSPIDKLGITTLIVAILIFFSIAYLTFTHNYKNQSYKIFAVGIVSLILIDLTLNILYTFGLLTVYPPSIYIFGYGTSIVTSSFLMIGILGIL